MKLKVSDNLPSSIPQYPLKTAVLFLVFNRLDTTTQVFEAIRLAKPPRLYIASDGSRGSREGEKVTVQAVRNHVMSHIDWKCEVKTLFREQNLGCKFAVSGAIDWFFENEEMGIILEDDCLPHPTFFRFCEELLERYRDDERIAMISGDNFQFGRKRGDASYYFSRYNHIWGWASWRRAWQHYDRNAKGWPVFRDEGYLDLIIRDRSERKHWWRVFQSVYEGRIDTWDYQWVLSAWRQGMISVMPNVNLISNIGFGPEATHTCGASIYSEIKTQAINFPLTHTDIVLPHFKADTFTAREAFSDSLLRRVVNKAKSLTVRALNTHLALSDLNLRTFLGKK